MSINERLQLEVALPQKINFLAPYSFQTESKNKTDTKVQIGVLCSYEPVQSVESVFNNIVQVLRNKNQKRDLMHLDCTFERLYRKKGAFSKAEASWIVSRLNYSFKDSQIC
jgi:hypothetical protein